VAQFCGVRDSRHGRAEDSADQFDQTVSQTIDHELELIRAAIAMVKSGASQRVVVASLHFGDQLLPRARALAAMSGLQATPLWSLDKHNRSIAIEAQVG